MLQPKHASRQVPVLVVLVVAVLSLSTSSAAQSLVSIDRPESPELAAVLDSGRSLIASHTFGNCGRAHAVRVTCDGPCDPGNTPWDRLVEESLNRRDVESIDLARLGSDESAIVGAVHTMTGTAPEDRRPALNGMIESVRAATTRGGLLYDAWVWGVNSLSLGYLAIVDTERGEIVTVGDGVCE